MFNSPRKIVLWLGLVFLLVGGFVAWRAAHPPLTEQEQIEAQVEEIRTAIENRNSGGTMKYLAKGFDYQGMTRGDLKDAISATFLQWREVKANFSGLHTVVQGDKATSTGHFFFSFRSEEGATPQTQNGDFKIYWEKRDGTWEIPKVDGGPNAPGQG